MFQSRFITEFNAIKSLIDTPNNTMQGFIVNLKCKRMEEIFHNNDHEFIFRDRNLWLFIDNSIEINVNDALVGF